MSLLDSFQANILAYDSLAALSVRILTSTWSIYAIHRSVLDSNVFKHMLTNPGTPCSLQVFSEWEARKFPVQVADTVLSLAGLVVAGLLTWTLVKRSERASMKCVGAPVHVVRIQKVSD